MRTESRRSKVDSRWPEAERIPGFESRPSALDPRPSSGPQPSTLDLRPTSSAFTLIELLIVIAIISILAAMIIPVTGAVTRSRIRAKARTELERVATGIELYKAKLGHYPPDNPKRADLNQLYFELLGTVLTNNTYVTLDGSAQVGATPVSLNRYFGFGDVGGFINTTRPGGGDEGRQATPFLNNLKPDESVVMANSSPPDVVRLLVVGVPGPVGWTNYISYVSSNPTNNANSYDLWVDVMISGKTNRISNWTKDPVVLP